MNNDCINSLSIIIISTRAAFMIYTQAAVNELHTRLIKDNTPLQRQAPMQPSTHCTDCFLPLFLSPSLLLPSSLLYLPLLPSSFHSLLPSPCFLLRIACFLPHLSLLPSSFRPSLPPVPIVDTPSPHSNEIKNDTKSDTCRHFHNPAPPQGRKK